MQFTSLASAKRLRALLMLGQASPALVRRALNAVPEEDRDEWVDVVLDIDEVFDDGPDLPRGGVPYLPCSIPAVLDAVEHAQVTSDDVLVDVGSGVGRVLFLAHLLTGASGIGIEVQSSLFTLAAGRARKLNLTRVQFIHGDAAELIQSITAGTVFFLYCPFEDKRLDRFLDGLEEVARTRPIRVCCVDMALLECPWLTHLGAVSSELDLYRSKQLEPQPCGIRRPAIGRG